jgi:hypothetical protein
LASFALASIDAPHLHKTPIYSKIPVKLSGKVPQPKLFSWNRWHWVNNLRLFEEDIISTNQERGDDPKCNREGAKLNQTGCCRITYQHFYLSSLHSLRYPAFIGAFIIFVIYKNDSSFN